MTFTGSVTIQNLEVFPVNVAVKAYGGNTVNALLNPRASKTFSANALGVPGDGGGVVAQAAWTSDAIDQMTALNMCPLVTQTTSVDLTRGTGATDSFSASGSNVTVTKIKQGNNTFTAGTDYSVSVSGSTVTITWIQGGSAPNAQDTYTVTYTSDVPDCGDAEHRGRGEARGADRRLSGDQRQPDDG